MRIVQKHQAAAVPEPPQKDDEEEYVSSRYHNRTVMEGLRNGPTGHGPKG